MNCPELVERRSSLIFALSFLSAISLFFFYRQIIKAGYQDSLGVDEAASILVSHAVATTFLPQTPSGLMYYVAPVAHYLNGLSIFLFGDSLRAARGASLFAYFLLMFLPGLLLILQRNILSGLLFSCLVGLDPFIQDSSLSARMYMVYTLFSFLSVFCLVIYRPLANDRKGIAYSILLFLAMFSHFHFVVILPALLIAGLALAVTHHHFSWRKVVLSPVVYAPVITALLGGLVFLNYKRLPRVWSNVESVPTVMGRHASFDYPLNVLGGCIVVWPIYVILLILLYNSMRRKPLFSTKFLLAGGILILAYLLLSVTLPAGAPKYVVALIPICYFTLASLGIKDEKPIELSHGFPWRLVGSVLVVGSLAYFEAFYCFRGSMKLGFKELMRPSNSAAEKRIELLRDWIKNNHPLVISSDPSVTYIRYGKPEYHVRSYGVAANYPLDRIVDGFLSINFIHSVALLEQIQRENQGHPIIMTGERTRMDPGGTISASVSAYIQEHYLSISDDEGHHVYANGSGKNVEKLVAEYISATSDPVRFSDALQVREAVQKTSGELTTSTSGPLSIPEWRIAEMTSATSATTATAPFVLDPVTTFVVRKIMEAEVATLRKARMSHTEYNWLIGQLVTQALINADNQIPNEPGDRAGKMYWDWLRKNEKPGLNFNAREFVQELQGMYGVNLSAPEWALKKLDEKSKDRKAVRYDLSAFSLTQETWDFKNRYY